MILNYALSVLLTLGAHAQQGLGLQYLVCVSVCLSVCLSTTILALHADYEAAYKR